MNFDKISKSEEEKMGWGGRRTGIPTEKSKIISIRLFFVLMLYIKFQVPGSSGSLVLTQTEGVADR